MTKLPQSATELTAKQAKFVASMLKHYTLEAACKELEISHETGRRMMQQEAVKKRYNEELQTLLDVALSRLYHLVEPAIAVLSKSLTEPEPNATRLRAASIILEKTLDLRTVRTHEERIAMLEGLAKGQLAQEVHREV